VSRDKYVLKNIRSVSPHIKLAVFEEAIARQITMSDVIGSALAEKFHRPYELSGEKSIRADLNGDQFMIQIPRALQARIASRARLTRETESSVVLGVLAEHFGLIHQPVRRGRRHAA